MKRAAAAPAPSPQRTIGEILLEHGYVTEEDLSAAVQRQQETGFPLGQILVEAGAITRLELASALAVQWADVAPARAPVEEPKGRGRTARRETAVPLEERLLGYTAEEPDEAWREEVRIAVRALAQRLDALELALDELEGPSGTAGTVDVDAAVAERLAPFVARLDEVVGRADSLDAAVETLGDELSRRAASVTSALERLAGRIDERPPSSELEQLRGELDALAAKPAVDAAARESLSALAARLNALAEQPAADPGRIDELAERLDQLARRPAGDPDLSARVDGLAQRLDALADPTALDDLRRALDSLADRPASDPVLAGRLEELAERLDALTQEPGHDPELAGRVDELSGIVGGLTAAVVELRNRAADDSALGSRVDDLAARLEAVADRAAPDPALTGRVDDLTVRLEGLVERVGELPSQPADEPRLAALAERLDALERQTGANAGPAGEGAAPAAEELEHLGQSLLARIDEVSAAWAEERAALDARLSELAARVAEAPAARNGAPAPADESAPSAEHDLNRLWFAVERLSLQLTEHHRTLGMLMGGGAGEDGRLDALASRIERLEAGGMARTAVGSGAEHAGTEAGEVAMPAELYALSRKVEELAQASEAGREKLLSQIEQMMSSIDWRFQRLESGGKAA